MYLHPVVEFMYLVLTPSRGVYVPCIYILSWSLCTLYFHPLVEFMYLVFTSSRGVYVPCIYILWWSLCTLYIHPLVEFMYLAFTRMPGEDYRRRLRSLLCCLCDVFRALKFSCVWILHERSWPRSDSDYDRDVPLVEFVYFVFYSHAR